MKVGFFYKNHESNFYQAIDYFKTVVKIIERDGCVTLPKNSTV